jgi:uncharacterized Fe-S radical SAM superfamily protein PflX
MGQYHPAGKVTASKYGEINRPIGGREKEQAVREAEAAGLWRFDRRRPRFWF